MSSYTSLWLASFALALLLELPLVALALPAASRARGVLASIVGNAVTHPLLWFVFPRVLPLGAAVVVGELVAVVVEGSAIKLIARISFRRAMLLSLAVNLYSWGVDEFITRALAPRLAAYWWGAPSPH